MSKLNQSVVKFWVINVLMFALLNIVGSSGGGQDMLTFLVVAWFIFIGYGVIKVTTMDKRVGVAAAVAFIAGIFTISNLPESELSNQSVSGRSYEKPKVSRSQAAVDRAEAYARKYGYQVDDITDYGNGAGNASLYKP